MDDLDSLAVNFIQLPPRALALALCNAAYLAWAEDPERNYAESYELAQRAVALDARIRSPVSCSASFARGRAVPIAH